MDYADDNSLLDDPKYRQYVGYVEKALRNFESSSEWADLISALAKLNKVLNAKYTVIPKKMTVGKRLSQCMHPALPGGVHLKALDVYNSIFKIIKTERLKNDLYIYSMGIFPLLVTASMQVRPVLLSLYEIHLLPLGAALRGCLDGLLLGLMPGLEEGNEHFERIDNLLEKICDKVSVIEFYDAIWRCVLSSSQARLSALQLILRRFDRKKSTDDQLFVIGSDINVMVLGLREALMDKLVLTQRSALDVLILVCPLSAMPVPRSDVKVLVQTSLLCVLRRDMSLNRRLYSWLLGYEQTKRQLSTSSLEVREELSYFEKYSRNILIEALSSMLLRLKKQIKVDIETDLYPLRLLVSLLDKAEIGPLIIEHVLVDVFRLLQKSVDVLQMAISDGKLSESSGNSRIGEIAKTANLLLGVFQPGYIWNFTSSLLDSYSANQVDSTCSNGLYRLDEKVSFSEICDFIRLLLRIVNTENFEEISTICIPNLLHSVLSTLLTNLQLFELGVVGKGLKTVGLLLDYCCPIQLEVGIRNGEVSEHNEPSDNNGPSTMVSDSSNKLVGNNHSVEDGSFILHQIFCSFVIQHFTPESEKVKNCLVNLEENFDAENNMFGSSESDKDPTLNIAEMKAVFDSVCNLICNFAYFPVYCERGPPLNESNSDGHLCFPEWFEYLVWCSCDQTTMNGVYFPFSLVAIQTILELVSFAGCQPTLQEDRDENDRCVGTVYVRVLSPLLNQHSEALQQHTSFYQLVTKRLWGVLGIETMCSHYIQCVQLLLNMNSVCRDGRCEVVLLQDIINSHKDVKIAALRKFCLLWHLVRIITQKKNTLHFGKLKLFNRCLFAVVDALSPSSHRHSNPSSPFLLDAGGCSVVTATASSWLRECLEERDLLRVLEPYLLILLSPSSHSVPLDRFDPDNATTSSPSAENSMEKENVTFSESSVRADIENGKRQYRDLISTLSTSEQDTEFDLDEKAAELSQQIIEQSIKIYLKLKSNENNQLGHLTKTDLIDSETCENSDYSGSEQSIPSSQNISSNILVYQEDFDASRVYYSLQSILTLVQTHPQLFTYTASTLPICPHESRFTGGLLQDLLGRHLHALAGNSFYADNVARPYNVMIVEVLVKICLRYIRSWHPRPNFSLDSLHDVRSSACSLLSLLLHQMTLLTLDRNMTSSMTSQGAQQFGAYVGSILRGNKVGQVVLGALHLTTQALGDSKLKDNNVLFTNEENVTTAESAKNVQQLESHDLLLWWLGRNETRVRSFQSHLLALLRDLIVFEHHFTASEGKDKTSPVHQETEITSSDVTNQLSYLPGKLLCSQPLLAASIIQVLRLQSARSVHVDWLEFVTSLLPFITSSLPDLLTPVTSHICRNLEMAANLYVTWSESDSRNDGLPVDYVTSLLKSLRVMTHFTLLLHASAVQHSFKTDKPTSSVLTSSSASSTSQASNLPGLSALGSLFNVFSAGSSVKNQRNIDEQTLPAKWVETRLVTLKNLPRLLSCLAVVWHKAVAHSATTFARSSAQREIPPTLNPCVAMGDADSVSQSILQLLNPIALQYGENLVKAVAIVWERRGRATFKARGSFFETLGSLNDQQGQLLQLFGSIKSLHFDGILNIIKGVIVQPPELPAVQPRKKQKSYLEESLLSFTLHCLRQQKPNSFNECWPNLLSLLRECHALPPALNSHEPASVAGGRRQLGHNSYFLLLVIAWEFAKKSPTFEDKKDQKDLQDICIKCVEACNTIVACSLEHGGWLARKSPSVLPQQLEKEKSKKILEHTSSSDLLDPHTVPNNIKSTSSDPCLKIGGKSGSESPPEPISPPSSVMPANPNYRSSVQALDVLSHVLSNLLDVIFGSEEKDKMVPVLTPVMNNAAPYLRNHSVNNVPSYIAAVRLLSGLSGYQQTRKSWKRDAYELFLEPSFFKMPPSCVGMWCNVVDHLMTHDSTTFKEFMARISLTRSSGTSPSLYIFTSKEQELELRAMLLKRLAYVIFSSDVSQYQRHLPEIQERLSESLRWPQVPLVQEQVFLCFRVLLIRVSPNHLTSFWPSIITELVQVIGQIEQDLTLQELENDVTDVNEKKASAAPSSGVGILFSNVSGFSTSSTFIQDKWMKLYLSACKLLDLALILRPEKLSHFKMFRWSFVGEPGEIPDDEKDSAQDEDKASASRDFVPHCVRIKRLMEKRNPSGASLVYDVTQLRPLLEISAMTSVLNLQTFFNTIVAPDTMLRHYRLGDVTSLEEESVLKNSHIEKLLHKDFVEEIF